MRKGILLLLILLLVGQARAAEAPPMEEVLEQERDLLGIRELENALPQSVRELYLEESALLKQDFGEGARQILLQSLSQSGGALRDALKTGAMLLSAALLCSIFESFGSKGAQLPLRLAGVLAVTLLCGARYDEMVLLGSGTLEETAAFSRVLLPVLAGAAAASGAPTAAAALYAGTVFFSGLLEQVMLKLFLPLSFAYLACACAEHSMDEAHLGRICGLLKGVITVGLKLLLTCFSAYLAITGVVSGSADSAAVRAAKLALSTAVPVVGSVIGDASETVLVSAGMIRSGVGVMGLLGVLAICIGPFLRLGAQYLVLKLFAALASTVAPKSIVGMMDAAASCMGLLLAMVGASALFNLISCVCLMKAAVP